MGLKYYGYDEFVRDLKLLITKIDWEFNAIVAISRGGLTIAHFLGEYYNIRNVFTINAIGYDDQKKLDEVRIFNIPDLRGFRNVLVVDEIVDSGETMQKVMQKLGTFDVDLKSAVIFVKPHAIYQPDFFVQYTTEWIDFFWTRDLYDTNDRQLR